MQEKVPETATAYTHPVLIGRLARWLGLNRAVGYGIAQSAWRAMAGPVTALLISLRFTPETQGFYYTFSSLLVLQVFAEMGLGTVLVQFASHEKARLSLDERGGLHGDPDSISRLLSLGRFAFAWYGVAAVVSIIGLGAGGYVFLSRSAAANIHWVGPWTAVAAVSSLLLCVVPIWSLLEGCNKVGAVYAFRFSESVLTSVSLWSLIGGGAGLWAPACSSLVRLAYNIGFLRRRFAAFLACLRIPPRGPRVEWRSGLLGMQWRYAVSWLCGYFCFWMFTPVAFHYQGAVVAGQMGMTWSLLRITQSVGGLVVESRVPTFGEMIARGELLDLDRLIFRIGVASVLVSTVTALGTWLGVCLLYATGSRFASRMLAPLPTGLFLAANVLLQVSSPFSAYLRAHRKEPLMGVSLAFAVLIGLCNWYFGSRFGPIGMAWGYLIASAVLGVPGVLIVWARCRAKWHPPMQTAALRI